MNCEKITYYIEKGYLTELNVSEKLQVKLHSALCKSCRKYLPDSLAVNDILKMLNEEDKTTVFTNDEKKELKKALESLQ